MSLSPDTMRPLLPTYAPEQVDAVRAPKNRQEALQQQDQYWGEDGLTFADFLDIINPLQHIPGVSKLYRELTGDEISDGARIVGGATYGGPLGLIAAVTDSVVSGETGKDMADHVVTALKGNPERQAKQLAELSAPAPLPYTEKVTLPPTVKSEPLPQWAPESASDPLKPLYDVVSTSGPVEQTLPWARKEPTITQASAAPAQAPNAASWVTNLEYLPAPAKATATQHAAAAYQGSANTLPWLKEQPITTEYLEAGQPELPAKPYITA